MQGTERQPYEQHIRIIGEGRQQRIIGWCSCPVGANCKHVGAVLLTALRLPAAVRTDDSVAGLAPDLAAWLDKLEAATSSAPTNDYPPEIRQRLVYMLDPGKRWQTPPRLSLSLYSVRLLKAGGYSSYASPYSASNAFNQPPAKFLRPIDVEILQELAVSAR
ncbi:MAG: SWIM zinc finger family protein [Hyphomicrobiales bacterium]